MKTSDIRTKFIRFFESRGHRVVPSDGLIPREDPSLLFSGAGMNQFKEYFLGLKKDLTRAVSVQKCLRTGDLDNVGRTPYHHSFFEMLGNFSFGDYFKKEAIHWAWEFLVGEMKIPEEKLRVSVYKDDAEALGIWQNDIGLAASGIAKLDDKSNFWPAGVIENGPNGPCGPCSEIYFNQGAHVGCGRSTCSVECDCGRFAEIWNLVFTQFDRQSDGRLTPLKAKNIDTGMGLERLACVLQKKRFNFEIDIFEPIVSAVRKRASALDEKNRADLYAICDHIRAVTFAIADGAYPSNEGRGYVIRKLIRRTMWRARKLGMALPSLSELIETVRAAMGNPYTEIVDQEHYVEQVVKNEETRFLETLEKGMRMIAERNRLDSEDVFLLYDTFGFPMELTHQMALERGMPIDASRVEELMEAQRERAKQGSKISANIFSVDLLKQELAKRNFRPTVFCGYETLEVSDTVIEFMVDEKGQSCDTLPEGALGLVVVRETPFYAEGGGQVGDQGEYTESTRGGWGEIVDTFKKDHLFFHRLKVVKGMLKIGDRLHLSVDRERRQRTMFNHTATHLLHAALRKVLGSHVRQLGSVVEPKRLRFDFSHFKALTADEIRVVEDMVNGEIQKAVPVSADVKNFEKAKQEGAIAFFGDKYGDQVRVVTVGDFSKELCGGTHVKNIHDIGRFRIISEGSVGSGTRRIEAVTSTGVDEYFQEEKRRRDEDARRRASRQARQREDEHTADRRYREVDQDRILATARRVKDYSLVVHYIDSLDQKQLGALADALKSKLRSGVIVLCAENDGKLQIIVAVTPDSNAGSAHAGELIRKISELVKGRGGGRKDFAQGGGEPPPDRQAFLENVYRIAETALR